MPRTMITREKVREPLYIIIVVVPGGTTQLLVTRKKYLCSLTYRFLKLVNYCRDRKSLLKPVATA